MVEGVVQYIEQHGLDWIVEFPVPSFGELEAVKIDEHWQGDALILFRASEAEREAFQKRGIKVVLLSSESGTEETCRVVPDNFQLGQMAAEHLMESQVPNMAFFGRSESFYEHDGGVPRVRRYSRERCKGFVQKCVEHEVPVRPCLMEGVMLWKEDAWKVIEQRVQDFLKSVELPCGIFAADDGLAAVVMKIAQKLGLRIPEDLLLIGFSDDPFQCMSCSPAISSIRYPGEKVGFIAAERIAALVSDKRVDPIEFKVPCRELIARGSSKAVFLEDDLIVNLVRWIRLTAPTKNITLEDLSELAGVSVSTVKERFKKALGHTAASEIRRVRYKHLLRLLQNSRRPISEIASGMGFSSPNEASRFFSKMHGCSPSECREEARELGR